MRSVLRLAVFTLWVTPGMTTQHTIPAAEGAKYVGEKATVCGVVANARYASDSKGQPTFLNLDKPYPHPVFNALIWGEDRSKFNRPEVRVRDKRVCATGMITQNEGVPEIALRAPSQLWVE